MAALEIEAVDGVYSYVHSGNAGGTAAVATASVWAMRPAASAEL